ncbi:WXG100 family type VII secretion target [Nocardia crassostreae]|uniref:WXG100 family type VII secretion target n=1 Tax=Nocardia crassostreae TaxID=53428 RepID=UPI000AB330D6|nr:hypothetical protein [Nocardia crassostreae]
MDPEVLRRTAQQSLRGAEIEQRRISGSAVDPDYVQRLEHFGGLSHERIYACVQAMDPGEMHACAETWVNIADNLCGDVTGLTMTVLATLADGPAGRIAEAADIAARQFVRQAMDVAEILHSTGHRLTAAAYGAEVLRKTVPPPPIPLQGDQSDPTATYLALVLGAPGDAHDFEAAREEQYRLALAALEANYVPIYPPAGSGVPPSPPSRCPARPKKSQRSPIPELPKASAPHPYSRAHRDNTTPIPPIRSVRPPPASNPSSPQPHRLPPRKQLPPRRCPPPAMPIPAPTPPPATATSPPNPRVSTTPAAPSPHSPRFSRARRPHRAPPALPGLHVIQAAASQLHRPSEPPPPHPFPVHRPAP